jgi:hypothetical protein
MDRTSGQPQVNLSLMRSISLQFDLRTQIEGPQDLCKRTKNLALVFIADKTQRILRFF